MSNYHGFCFECGKATDIDELVSVKVMGLQVAVCKDCFREKPWGCKKVQQPK